MVHIRIHHSRIQDRYPVVESITFLSRFINFIFKFTFKCGARLLSLEFIYAATAILLYSYVINAAAFRGINADSYKIYTHRERDRKGIMHFLPNKYSKHKFIVSIHHHHHWSSTRLPLSPRLLGCQYYISNKWSGMKVDWIGIRELSVLYKFVFEYWGFYGRTKR